MDDGIECHECHTPQTLKYVVGAGQTMVVHSRCHQCRGYNVHARNWGYHHDLGFSLSPGMAFKVAQMGLSLPGDLPAP